MISVSVLGPVELRRDGVPVPVRPGKTTELLVRLALEAGVMVRTERLIEDLWAEEAASIARNPLQTKVSRLRRSLGDGALVTGTRAGYVLNVAPGAVDALEVLRLAGEAARVRASDPAAALALRSGRYSLEQAGEALRSLMDRKAYLVSGARRGQLGCMAGLGSSV